MGGAKEAKGSLYRAMEETTFNVQRSLWQRASQKVREKVAFTGHQCSGRP